MSIISCTGHRPKYLPCGYDENHPWLISLIEDLNYWIRTNQPSQIISGVAIGWDTWVAEAALVNNIPLLCYIPFKGQEQKWPQKAQDRYNDIIKASKASVYISKAYHPNVFFDRNRDMVDDSDTILSLLSPDVTSGGTYFTVNYARAQKKSIINFWPNED